MKMTDLDPLTGLTDPVALAQEALRLENAYQISGRTQFAEQAAEYFRALALARRAVDADAAFRGTAVFGEVAPVAASGGDVGTIDKSASETQGTKSLLGGGVARSACTASTAADPAITIR